MSLNAYPYPPVNVALLPLSIWLTQLHPLIWRKFCVHELDRQMFNLWRWCGVWVVKVFCSNDRFHGLSAGHDRGCGPAEAMLVY
jgi:hypothetical protein